MARVPYVAREELDAEGQAIYDQIRQDRNAAEVGLQFRALLHSPKAAGHLTSMGAQLRFQSSMPDSLKELAIILVAREWTSGIEWTGHADVIESIRTWKAPEGLDADEAKVARFVHESLRGRDVSDETFSAVQELLGVQGVVDLTLTVSYYSALAIAQNALKPEMGAGRISTL